jgi:RNAse (barnase) inhibitor barstar
MKTLIIDGNNFSDLAEFYNEVESKLTKNLDWKIGRNLDAFNDVLRGGFGQFDYKEKITLIWQNAKKSKSALGYKETIKYLKAKMERCHPSNIPKVKKELANAKKGKG